MPIARTDSGRWTMNARGRAVATAGCGRDELGLSRNPFGACDCCGHDDDVVKVRGTIIADFGRDRSMELEAVAMLSICVKGPAAAECGRGRAAMSAGS